MRNKPVRSARTPRVKTEPGRRRNHGDTRAGTVIGGATVGAALREKRMLRDLQQFGG